MRPWENARLEANYFGVIDRGIEQVNAPPIKQGGHEDHLLFTSPLPHGWRAVADLDQLTSLTFRLAWSETYTQAVNSEVLNTAFLTNNFDGFSVNFAALSYKNFLSASPQSSITLRTAPVAQFSSVDRAPFHNLPFYFSFDAFTGAEHREENVTPFSTPGFVERSEFAPSVTMPLHWGRGSMRRRASRFARPITAGNCRTATSSTKAFFAIRRNSPSIFACPRSSASGEAAMQNGST